jgi:ABC-type bacteriocin/lantibiotic exporter with double-glycine peptidase domain
LPVDKTDHLVTHYLDARTRHFKVLVMQYWALIVFKVLITAGMLIVGGVLLVQNQINIGQFVASEIVILTVLASVEKLIQSLDKVYDVLTSVEKLGKVLDKPLEHTGSMQIDSSNGLSVSMQKLSFGYHEAAQILKGISFTVNRGQKVCFMGTEGSGKSTILRLLTGSYMEFEGSITINDGPLGNYNPNSLRSITGILFHQQDIFEGTLHENIALGDTSITSTQIVELARKIGLESFLSSLKNGFDTPIDAVGKRLSGGVIRKILLLRALLSQPRLLLLEEPWQGLDDERQNQVKGYLLKETPGTTVLVTTNDESFARQCDYVIVLEHGTILKQGTPSQLF